MRIYKKLTDNTKRLISTNANAYAKENYKSINLKLAKEVLADFDSLAANENCSRPEFLKKLLENYKNSLLS
ncbi:CopG family transcriptional regulator [Pasteurella multocida]|uniref:CopG family transcriptional regulator n=1 Tax=Pasteurella multocida TaxID=747 RepID=UPI00292D0C17|nr:CopG family transcriptional regulator [Pasteurella multocida]WNY73110.1 CopG family transcriptional regulator [Pasteurella multocida]